MRETKRTGLPMSGNVESTVWPFDNGNLIPLIGNLDSVGRHIDRDVVGEVARQASIRPKPEHREPVITAQQSVVVIEKAALFASRAFGALIVKEYLKIICGNLLYGKCEVGLTEFGARIQNDAQLRGIRA